MRHQVERLKHVALRQGVKPARALTATLVAVAMMATMAVTSVAPSRNANAANADSEAGICTPKSVSLGTDTDTDGRTKDTGIATYVGGDMYVGQKVSGSTMNNTSGPKGSYAAEAEGLTAVNGKLLLHPLKGVWATYYTSGKDNGKVSDYKGFRFGIVGFGGQYRPASGSSVLDVNGKELNSEINWVGGAQAWGNAGWIGKTKTDEPSYVARISGQETKVYPGSSNPVPSNGTSSANRYNQRPSVYDPSNAGSVSWWNQTVDKIGFTNDTFDSFKSYIGTLSMDLSRLRASGTSGSVYTAGAQDATNSNSYEFPSDGLKRSKYNGKYTFTINIHSVNEKVILFKGNDTSSMQVFNLPASMLNDSSYSGVSFAFENIPDSSSVVINVTGPGAQNITFHNGWRFWWNKSELGDSYTNPDYTKRAQQIMWNFPQTQNLTIQGGQGTGPITIKQISAAESAQGVWGKTTGDANTSAVKTTDDPAAGLLGSVLVPNGSFESHVSTNGRVWVGGDFSMYNPNAVALESDSSSKFVNVERSYSASALDMDQERHNLPWNGSYSTQCAAIAWDKVDASTHTAVPGTTWAVYASENDAQSQSYALKTVTDNAYGDDESKEGSFSIGGLNPNATYYIREVSSNNSAYATNTNIYAIKAGNEGTTARVVTNVYNSEGGEIPDPDKKLLPSSGDSSTNAEIANKKSGTSIEWSKVDGTDNDVALAGSEWQLTRTDTDPQQSWTITDNTTTPQSVALSDASGKPISDLTLDKSGDNALVTVTVDPNDASQEVKWTGTQGYEQVARISPDEGSGTFNIIAVGKGSTSFAVCSASDTSVCAKLNVKVSSDSVKSLTLYKAGDTSKTSLVNQNVSLKYNGTLQLAAEVQPVNTVKTWESSNPNVATVSNDGLVTAVSAGNTDITVKAGNLSRTVHITVKPKSTVVYYYRTDGTPQIHYAVGDVWNTLNVNDDPAMASVSGCNNWYSYEIANPDSKAVKVTFHVGNNWDNNGGSNSSYASGGYVEAMTIDKGKLTTTVPAISDCNVSTVAARNINAHVYSAVLKSGETDGIAANFAKPIADEETISTKADLDSGVGKFRVSLDNGKYTLKETKAPTGYVLSETTYTIVVRDGQIVTNESNLPTDNKIPNDRKNGVVVWDKKDTGDDGSSATNDDSLLGGTSWTLTQTQAWNAETASMVAVSGDDYTHTLTDNGGDGVYADKDSTAGKFRFEGLPWGVYTLKEQKRDGFAPNNTTYAFVIDSNSVSEEIHLTIVGSTEKFNATAETVYNNRETGSVTWAKVAAGTSTKLSGSQWTLKRVSVWNGTAFAALNSAETWNITDCDATCTPVNAGYPYDSDATAGQFKLAGLKWGEYELVETVAPDGYNLDTTAHKFTIGPKDSTVVLSVALGDIKNVPGVVLPSTGGEGLNKMYTAGFLAVAIAVAGLALSLRRRQS